MGSIASIVVDDGTFDCKEQTKIARVAFRRGHAGLQIVAAVLFRGIERCRAKTAAHGLARLSRRWSTS